MILAFKVFDEVYLLTGGGPGTATEVISFTIYRRFFTEDQTGYGSAMSVATIAVIAMLIIAASRLTLRRRGRHDHRRRPPRRPPRRDPAPPGARPLRGRHPLPLPLDPRGELQEPDRSPDGEVFFTPVLANFESVLFGPTTDFVRNFANSMVIALGSTLLVLVVATLAAWSLYRMDWPSWVLQSMLGWTVVFHMVPPITLAGAWYTMFRGAGLDNTYLGLILAHTRSTCLWRSG